MKKLLSLFITTLLALSIFTAVPTVSGAETLSNYKYVKLSDNTVKITKYIGKEKVVKIPSKLDGIKVVSVDKQAFLDNRKIVEVSMPNTIKEMGSNVFEGCTSLKKVKLSTKLSKIPKATFLWCFAMKKLDVPSNIVSIGQNAIPENLETLRLGKKLKNVSVSTLSGSEKLKKIEVAKGNKYFKVRDGVLYNKKMTKLIYCPIKKNIKDFRVPLKVKTIGKFSFSHKKDIERVRFTKNTKTIDLSSFSGCRKLTEINIPKNISFIGDYAFAFCDNLTKIKINPNEKLKVKFNAFAFNEKIAYLDVPNIKYGDSFMFEFCNSLKTINISSNVKTIHKYQFYNCPELTNVTVPKNVTKIKEKALGYLISDDGKETKTKGITIRGSVGSAAEKYAKDNNFKFIAI